MKLNLKKVGLLYRANIDGDELKFGWYESGRAFIAEDGKLLKALKCYQLYVPADAKRPGKHFIYNCIVYDKTIDGIVRFLRYKYCR